MSLPLLSRRDGGAKIVSFPRRPHSCYDWQTQSLHCEFCKETINLRRQSISNPERMAILIEAFEQNHKACKEFDNYRRARAEQIWRRGMALVN